jgi:hypothetical protein
MPELLRCADGEDVPRVSAHLQGCKRCREQVALIASAVAQASPDVKQVLNEIYSRLEARMDAWSSSHVPRLTAAVEFYFGTELAQRIRRETGAMASTEPLFRTFLGKRAADVLAQKLVRVST